MMGHPTTRVDHTCTGYKPPRDDTKLHTGVPIPLVRISHVSCRPSPCARTPPRSVPHSVGGWGGLRRLDLRTAHVVPLKV